MGSFKQQWLTWIIIFAAAVYVSCQEQGITSTLREGNYTCPGEEVTFNCTLRGSLALAWRSPGYIADGNALQFSTASMLGVEVLSRINGRITATAALTNNTIDNGEQVLESMLRITATVASMVTCSGTSGGVESIEFSVSVVPGVPQRISAAEISRPVGTTCIILVTWDPPANSDVSDVDRYTVCVPSHNIKMTVSSSTLTTLTVSNCGDDIRVQIAAVNRVGCVGMNSEVQPTLLDIPTSPTENGSITAEGGSALRFSTGQLGTGVVAGISIAVIITVVIIVSVICILSGIIAHNTRKIKRLRASRKDEFLLEEVGLSGRRWDEDYVLKQTTLIPAFDPRPGRTNAPQIQDFEIPPLGVELPSSNIDHPTLPPTDSIKPSMTIRPIQEKNESQIGYPLVDLYFVLRSQSRKKTENAETSTNFMMNTVKDIRALLEIAEEGIRSDLVRSLVILKDEKHDELQRALNYLMEIISDMSKINDEFKSDNIIEELRNVVESSSKESGKAKSSEKSKSGIKDEAKSSSETSLKNPLDNTIVKVRSTPPDQIKEILLRLCDTLSEHSRKLSPKQEEVVKKFDISLESMRKVERLLTDEFARGLQSEKDDMKVKMFDTHIHEMPNGTEEGEFLVVDMGVSYLRVVHINIIKGRIKKQEFNDFSFDETTKNSSYKVLFDFIVNCIAKFIEDTKIQKKLPIAFTFPFPMKHESLTCGKLIRWTRDFKATGGEGEDVIQLLKDAASKKGDMEVSVVALINDATGILLSVVNEMPDCHIGLALGDGANACYVEESDAIPKFKGDAKVIINTEWGAFGDDGKLKQWRTNYDHDDGKLDQGRTDYDGQPDDKPSNPKPKHQLFEKMISDKQQGVIVCRVLKDLISKKALFVGQTVTKFDEFEAFSRRRLGIMEGRDMEKCKRLFEYRFNIEASDKDCEVIRRVCEAVSTRAARLTAAAIVALVKKIKKTDGCTVAVDASLYKHHPQFPERIQEALDELEPGCKIIIKSTKDGSSVGAALAAAMSIRSSKGSEGQRGQQENIQSDAAEEHADSEAKNLISADVEVHPQPGDN